MEAITRRAIDPSMTFEERRRDRYVRRGVRRSRERALDAALAGIGLAGIALAGWGACWAVALMHGLGIL